MHNEKLLKKLKELKVCYNWEFRQVGGTSKEKHMQIGYLRSLKKLLKKINFNEVASAIKVNSACQKFYETILQGDTMSKQIEALGFDIILAGKNSDCLWIQIELDGVIILSSDSTFYSCLYENWGADQFDEAYKYLTEKLFTKISVDELKQIAIDKFKLIQSRRERILASF